MKSFDAATAAYLSSRGGMVAHRLVWITARNLSTDSLESLGLWSGEQDIAVTIAGQVRAYTGAGVMLEAENIVSAAGLGVRMVQLGLSAVSAQVEDIVKGYQTRFAPIEVHRAFFVPETGALVAAPHRMFRGVINSVEFTDAAAGENPACVIECASAARDLTRTLAVKKSDASQRRRADDRFRRYGDISGVVPIYWGERRSDYTAPPAGGGGGTGSGAGRDG